MNVRIEIDLLKFGEPHERLYRNVETSHVPREGDTVKVAEGQSTWRKVELVIWDHDLQTVKVRLQSYDQISAQTIEYLRNSFDGATPIIYGEP